MNMKVLPNNPLYSAHIIEEVRKSRMDENSSPETANRNKNAAESEVASLYYLPLQNPKDLIVSNSEQAKQSGKIEESQNFLMGAIQSVKDWFWGLLGYSKSEPIAKDNNEVIKASSLGHAPQLQEPEHLDIKRLSKAVHELHEKTFREKDMQEFEEELRKSSDFLMQLIKSSLLQRNLKQEYGVMLHEDLMERHNDNKEIRNKANAIGEDLALGKGIAKGIKWVNISVTGTFILGTACAFLSGGIPAIFMAAMPVAAALKSGLTLADGIYKYKNDQKEGDHMMCKEEIRVNSGKMHDHLDTTQIRNEEISEIFKVLIKQMKNHYNTGRAMRQ